MAINPKPALFGCIVGSLISIFALKSCGQKPNIGVLVPAFLCFGWLVISTLFSKKE